MTPYREPPLPLNEILARLNRSYPFASGEVTRSAIAIAPALSPNTVTFVASPPNAATG